MTSGIDAELAGRERPSGTSLPDLSAVSAESVLAAQKRSLELVLQGASVEAVLADLVGIVEASTPGAVAAVLIVDDQGRLRTASAASAFIKAVNALDARHLSAFCTAVAAGATILTQDIAADPLWAASKPLAEKLGFKAVWSHPIRDRDKRVLGAFVTFLRERRQPTALELRLVDTVSQTAALTLARHEFEAALARQRRTLDLAMEAAEMGAWRYTVADNICLYDERATRLYGLTDGRFLHDEENVKRVFHPDDLAPMWAAVAVAVDPLGDGRYDVEYRARQPDGSWRWLSAWGIVEFAGEGPTRKPVAIAGASRDITSIKTAQEELQRVNATLERRVVDEVRQRLEVEEALRQSQKMEALGQLTGGIAHDFNNMLAAIGGSLDLLKEDLARIPGVLQTAHVERMITSAMQGTERAALLTHRLLAFSRRQPLVPSTVALDRLVTGMSDLLRRTLGAAVEIETDLAPDLWDTFLDPNQFENALVNLAVNARDAMPNGGKLTIRTANCRRDDPERAGSGTAEFVSVLVTDTGVGMSEDVLAKAFEPFFTTKDKGQGTGLGLSQVYGFIRQSGGHIEIASAPGRGTTVELYLPRYVADSRVETDRKPVTAVMVPMARYGETVLVVEDDPDVCSTTAAMVAHLGYRVRSARDGVDALRLLDAHPEITLMFTDVGLPRGMNGRQLAELASARKPDLKVLFTTAYADKTLVHDGRLDASVDVLFKPFSRTDLALRLRGAFDKSAA